MVLKVDAGIVHVGEAGIDLDTLLLATSLRNVVPGRNGPSAKIIGSDLIIADAPENTGAGIRL